MKTKHIFLSVILFLSACTAFAWGPKGHAVVADVAASHISKKTAKKIEKVLDGQTMVDVSSWMDGLRGVPEYEYVRTWHYLNIDPGYTYDTMEKNPAGDVYIKLFHVVEQLKSGSLAHEKEKDYLRFLIHMVGDLHCPMHAGYRFDVGGNLHEVQWFGKSTSLHSVWDSKLIESCRPWSYSEWTKNIDITDKKEIKRITGSPIDVWRDDCLAMRDDIYASSPKGTNLSYAYCDKYVGAVQKQLLYAGLRLAMLLDEIYE